MQIALGKDRFCEPMLEKLGATVDSVDANAFEGANIIHDLNRPMPVELQGRYDVVFDGGTLEHVFNFSTAMRGCLELPEVGGHFIMTSPANNQMGHGFYQFSPELFFRIFSEENGYELRAIFLVPTFSEAVGSRLKTQPPSALALATMQPYRNFPFLQLHDEQKSFRCSCTRHSKATIALSGQNCPAKART